MTKSLPLVLLSVLFFACEAEPDPADAALFCSELAGSNSGCWSDQLDERCLEVYAECGENILTLESCPVQLSCN